VSAGSFSTAIGWCRDYGMTGSQCGVDVVKEEEEEW